MANGHLDLGLARPLPWKPPPLPSNTATCQGGGGVTPAMECRVLPRAYGLLVE